MKKTYIHMHNVICLILTFGTYIIYIFIWPNDKNMFYQTNTN